MSAAFEKPQCDETYIPTDADLKELAEYIMSHDIPYENEADYDDAEDWEDLGHHESYFFSNFEEHE